MVQSPPANAGDAGLNPGSGRSPWRRKWQPTPVFLPGKAHGQKSLVGYSPWRVAKSVRHYLATKQQQQYLTHAPSSPACFFLVSRWQAENKLVLDFAEALTGADILKLIPVVMSKEPQHLGHRTLPYLGGFLVPSFPLSPLHFWLELVNAESVNFSNESLQV